MTSNAQAYSTSEPSMRQARNENAAPERQRQISGRELSHERKALAHLLAPPDPPTWGPDWVKQERRWGHARAQQQQDPHSRILENMEKSRQVSRYKVLYILAAVIALGVCALAMFVDYSIINGDVWTRALANEYMQVPPALQSSVIFKSLQVVFAVLAVHFMLKITGKWGRTAFISVAFILTVLMVGSLGYIVAYNNMDMGTSARLERSDDSQAGQAGSGDSSIDRLLQSVGQSSPQNQQPTLQPAVSRTTTEASTANAGSDYSLGLPRLSERSLANAQGWFWLGFASVIFFIVTTVCALYMQTAENNIRNWLIARDYRVRHAQYKELADKGRAP